MMWSGARASGSERGRGATAPPLPETVTTFGAYAKRLTQYREWTVKWVDGHGARPGRVGVAAGTRRYQTRDHAVTEQPNAFRCLRKHSRPRSPGTTRVARVTGHEHLLNVRPAARCRLQLGSPSAS